MKNFQEKYMILLISFVFLNLNSENDVKTQPVESSLKLIRSISAEELKDKMNNDKTLKVINLLSPKYYNDCHIKDSINIPADAIVDATKDWKKDTEMVVYCAVDVCDLSKNTYRKLESVGFNNLYDYSGGMKEWYCRGYPCVGPAKEYYLHEDK